MRAESLETDCLQRFSDDLREAAGSEICRDMNGYAASQALLAKSAKTKETGWKRVSHPKEAWDAPELSQRKTPEPWVCRAIPLIPMTKAELHRLVDALPDESLLAAAILLRRAQDPTAAKLDAAPYEDTELIDDDLRALLEARREPGISWSGAKRNRNAG